MDFLPQGYEVPNTADNYMKFEAGENVFRILAKPILGYLYWKENGGKRTPMRVTMDGTISEEELGTDPKTGELQRPKHFWAMPVYNRKNDKIQILEITQKGILKAITALGRSPKWGSPLDFDIIVTREGEGLETSYSILPEPKEELDKDIAKKFKSMNINLEALFEGNDPFAREASAPSIDIEDVQLD